jgi:hydrogenase maturation protein HypF
LRQKSGARRLALSGGVFQNVLLLRLARSELAARGHHVLTHRLVPPNDGGLALGQAVVGARCEPTRGCAR